jgi:hypothetical protein
MGGRADARREDGERPIVETMPAGSGPGPIRLRFPRGIVIAVGLATSALVASLAVLSPFNGSHLLPAHRHPATPAVAVRVSATAAPIPATAVAPRMVTAKSTDGAELAVAKAQPPVTPAPPVKAAESRPTPPLSASAAAGGRHPRGDAILADAPTVASGIPASNDRSNQAVGVPPLRGPLPLETKLIELSHPAGDAEAHGATAPKAATPGDGKPVERHG